MNSRLDLPVTGHRSVTMARKAIEPPVDPAEFRRTVALFATGIVIVSCEMENGEVQGMTVNSFTSISLAPPTVMVSLKPGATGRQIERGGRFGVSVLHESQQEYSAHFSGRSPTGEIPDFARRVQLPTLRNCLAWFECEVIRAVEVYDHTLHLAHVTACGGHGDSPLVYFGSHYHSASRVA